MQKINKIIVALDHSFIDEKLIRFSKVIQKLYDAKEIEFIHVFPKLFLPKLGSPDSNDDFSNIDNIVKGLIQQQVNKILGPKSKDFNYKVTILQGSPYRELSKKIKDEKIELLIAGKKSRIMGSGLTPRRISQLVKTNVFLIPEGNSENITRIMVPIDFSENCFSALNLAIKMRSILKDVKIFPVHVLNKFRAGHYINTEASNEHNRYFKKEAVKEWSKLIMELGLENKKLDAIYLENENRNKASRLMEFVEDLGIDLVIMGAQGKNNFQKILYGSVTEGFVNRNTKCPTLIVR